MGDALTTAPAFPCKDGAQVIWIADTGSANHLCSHDTLPDDVFESMRPCPDVRLATANGTIEPEGQLEAYLTDLGVDARLFVLKDCPPVLSIGRLVEQHGFQFHWNAGKAWFVAPGRRRHVPGQELRHPHPRVDIIFNDKRRGFGVSGTSAEPCCAWPRDSQ